MKNLSHDQTYQTWADAEAAIHQLAAEDSSLVQDTIGNALLLAGFAAGRYQTPSWIGPGYWPTIRICWSTPDASIEIETFDDHYEFYRFFDGATEIQNFDTGPGDVPDALSIILDTLIAQTPMIESDKA